MPFFFGFTVDGPVSSVVLERSGLVADQIAGTDDLLEIGQASLEIANRTGNNGIRLAAILTGRK